MAKILSLSALPFAVAHNSYSQYALRGLKPNYVLNRTLLRSNHTISARGRLTRR